MSTPFSDVPAPYAGSTPMWPEPWPDRSARVWLGTAGSMIELPPVSPDNLTDQPSRGEVVKGLYGGGAAVIRFASATRSWTLDWPSLIGREWQLISAFHRDAFGAPPWCLLMQDDVNKLTMAQSMCTGSGWTPTGTGTVAAASSSVSPAVTPGGVMLWTPGASSAQLVAGAVVSGTPTPDVLFAAPVVPAEFVSWSFYAWVASGTGSLHARLSGVAADGSGVTAVNGSSVTVGTSPTVVSVVVGPAGLGAGPWVLPSLVADSNTAFYVSNPQVSYTSAQEDWEIGTGVPRVVPTGPPTRDLSYYPSNAVSWAFAEAYPGAC